MPISTTQTKTVITEKKISKITIDDDNGYIQLELVWRDKYEDGHIIRERRDMHTVSGITMLELVGIEPRVEVPSGKNYYEAVRDRCYEYLEQNNIW